MAFRRLSIRKIHSTLRLFFEAGLSIRAIARTLRVSPAVPAKAGTELNRAIAELLARLNARPFHKLPGSRRRAFESTDRPALRALPAGPYVFAQWKKVRVHLDSHVELDRHDYSVPHPLVGRQLLARYTAHTIELLDRRQRVASHRRSHQPGRHTTIPEHMPEPHRRFAQQYSPERYLGVGAHGRRAHRGRMNAGARDDAGRVNQS